MVRLWQDIDSAPTDGTLVDLWCEVYGRLTNCRFSSGKWFKMMREIDVEECGRITHWMEYPCSPQEEGEQRGGI
jgi:hypothetical protein